MFLPLISLFIGALAGSVSGQHNKCRCLPSDACWPSQQEWSALNNSLDGNLFTVTPIGKSCHQPDFDLANCAEVNVMASNSSWRSDQVGAGQWANWEAWPLHNDSCYVDSDRRLPCKQGRVSVYSATVRSTKHIQTAIKFAARHNIRLAIKNTGHDFADMDFMEIFTPDGFTGTQDGLGPAVTVGAGVQHELYQFCVERNVTVVAGNAKTVGIAGGYIQGGGHSVLGPWKGMAADNALEFSVITADGSVVIANDYQNQDLFWALRGGGGGTFGVVTSVTLRAHPDPPVVAASLSVDREVPDKTFWSFVERLYEHVPGLSDFGFSGTHVVYPRMPTRPENSTVSHLRAIMTFDFLFVGQPTVNAVRTVLAPLEAAFRSCSDGTTLSDPAEFKFRTTAYSSFGKYMTKVGLKSADPSGALTAVGSRLISRAFITTSSGPAAIATTLSRLRLGPGEAISNVFAAGGAVARKADTVSCALLPAWRRALSHVFVVRGWGFNSTLAEQQRVQRELTEDMVPQLKRLKLADEPAMGSYLNEADAHEPGFQSSFFGSNYRKLYAIKQKWDPRGLFVVRKGVGSEDWDDDGLCRLN